MTKKEEKEIKERRNRLQKARNVNYREFITRQLDVAAEVAKELLIKHKKPFLPNNEFKMAFYAY